MKVDFHKEAEPVGLPRTAQGPPGYGVRANGSKPLGSEGLQLAAELMLPVFQVTSITALGRLKADTRLKCSLVTGEFVNMI